MAEQFTEKEMMKGATSIFDLDHDGDVDWNDFKTGLRMAAAVVFSFVKNTAGRVGPSLPKLLLGVVVAAAQKGEGKSGAEKKNIALQDAVQALVDAGVHAAVAEGEDELSTLASHYGLDKSDVNLALEMAYATAKARHLVR